MSQIHAKTDKLSLVAVPEKDGKMRVTSLSWDDPLAILPGRRGHAVGRKTGRETQVELYPFGARFTVTCHAPTSKMHH
jgi:hypothetical protein